MTFFGLKALKTKLRRYTKASKQDVEGEGAVYKTVVTATKLVSFKDNHLNFDRLRFNDGGAPKFAWCRFLAMIYVDFVDHSTRIQFDSEEHLFTANKPKNMKAATTKATQNMRGVSLYPKMRTRFS